MVSLLRQGLLDGQVVAFAGGGAGALRDACARLGAQTAEISADLQDEDAVAAAVAAVDPVPHTLVCATGELDGSFIATRAVASAWIAAAAGGKVVLLAPPGDAAVRAALENLARTLSVEWARFGIRPTAVLPAPATADAALCELVCFLASPAGDYYSGCAFTLG